MKTMNRVIVRDTTVMVFDVEETLEFQYVR